MALLSQLQSVQHNQVFHLISLQELSYQPLKSISAQANVSHSKAPNSHPQKLLIQGSAARDPLNPPACRAGCAHHPSSFPPGQPGSCQLWRGAFLRNRRCRAKFQISVRKPPGGCKGTDECSSQLLQCIQLSSCTDPVKCFPNGPREASHLIEQKSPNIIFLSYSHVFHKLKSFFFSQTHSGVTIPYPCFQLTCKV